MITTRSGILLSLVLLLTGCTPPAGARQDEQLNVVVILVDDMGWADLGGYGSDLHRTPIIDGLAAGAMKFTQAYASASVCSPTRAALMTGKAPARLNMTIWHEAAQRLHDTEKLIPPLVEGNLPHSEVTLAEAFKEAGYRTGHIGKWHLGDAAHYPETHGFEYTMGGTFWGAPASFYFPYRGLVGRNREMRYVPGIDAGEPREGEYLTDRLTDEALAFIDRVAEDPFFLFMSYYTVHTPIEGKPEIAAKYEAEIQDGMNHNNAHYAAMHETLDNNVGRILEKLVSLGIADQTAIVFTSDNGGFVNEYQGQVVTSNAPLRSGKGSLYEGGVRVPLIVHWPGVTQAGVVSEEPVVTADLYPTLLDMAGVSESADHVVDGLSLAPLLTGRATNLDREALYWHYPHYYPTTTPVSAVRYENWKLLEYFEDGRVELYNLEKDPGEAEDLASTNASMAAELLERLHQWREEIAAPLPRRNPNYEGDG